ncbi:MAG: DUF4838 domain-containing protein [Victivallaceae bacterium]|jgi:hypothetical protein
MSNLNYRLLFAFVLCLTICINSKLLAASLVIEGNPEATIVIPDKAPDSVSRAAWELQHHVKKVSGATLPIITESKLPAKSTILVYLGSCKQLIDQGLEIDKLKRNEAIISIKENNIFIAGKDDSGQWAGGQISTGTLFAIYELLENDFGIRWLWPGELGEYVPQSKNILLKDGKRKIALPLKFAHWRVPSGLSNSGWSSATTKNDFLNAQEIWKLRHRFNIDVSLQFYPHAFTTYWQRFSVSNPDLFNLLPDGTRRPDPFYFNGRTDLISMCVSNPELHKQIVQDWIKTGMLKGFQININENDTAGKCVCDKCLSWDNSTVPDTERRAKALDGFTKKDPTWYEALGSVSNRYARFAMAVMAEADRVMPDKSADIAGLIYANYSNAPNIKLSPRIIQRYCPPIMFPWTDAKVERYKKDWLGWYDSGVGLIMRPNFTLDGNGFPIFYAQKYAECFSFAAKRRMIGLDMDSLTGMYAAQGPNLYMIARMQSNLDISAGDVLNEFYGAFGPAAKNIKEYFEYLEKVSNSSNIDTDSNSVEGGSWATFYQKADKIFTPEVFANCHSILEQAIKNAAEDETAVKRVKFLQIGLYNAELTANTQKCFRQYKNSGTCTAFADALQRLDQFRQDNEKAFFANVGLLQFTESHSWPREMMRLANQNMQALPLQWNFMWDPEGKGEQKLWFTRDFDDSKWFKINVDQVWEKQPVGIEWQKQHNSQYDGDAWYRLVFNAPKLGNGEKLVILFGAVDEACQVWVNGKKALDRPYPFNGNVNSWQEAFEIDITEIVEFDKPNLVAVKVIDKFGAGGIWKPVYLKIIPKPLSQAENLIKNSSFEQGESAWIKNAPMGKVEFIVDKTNFHSGQASGAIKVITVDPAKKYAGKYGTWARWVQSLNNLEPGKKYQLQAWVFTSMDFDGMLDIWIRSGTNAALSKANINLSWITTGGTWQALSMEFVPEKNNGTIYLNMMADRGSVNFDDIVLCPETVK